MKKLFTAAVLLSLTACIGWPGLNGGGGQQGANGNTNITPQDIIGFVHDTINTLNNRINQLDQTQSIIEQVTGPIDTNHDGIISPDEAKAAAEKLAMSKDPRAADLLANPAVWVLLSGSYLGFHGVKGGSVALVKSVIGKLADHINDQNNAGNGNGNGANGQAAS